MALAFVPNDVLNIGALLGALLGTRYGLRFEKLHLNHSTIDNHRSHEDLEWSIIFHLKILNLHLQKTLEFGTHGLRLCDPRIV